METLKEIVSILDEIEELTDISLIKFHLFSDQSGAFIVASTEEDKYLFQFYNFDEIEENFIDWIVQNAEWIEEQKKKSESTDVILGGCG